MNMRSAKSRPPRPWYPIAAGGLLLFLMYLHGTLPWRNGPQLTVQVSLAGRAACLAESPTIFQITCSRMGYPIGHRSIEGFPLVLAIALFHKYAAIPYVDCIQLLLSLFLLVGALSLMWWISRVSGNILAGLLSVLLFYSSAYLVSNSGMPDLYPASLLFPFFVVSSLVLLERIGDALTSRGLLRLAIYSILQVAILEFAVLVSGYVYVMTVSALTVWCVAGFAASTWRTRKLAPRGLAIPLLYAVLLFLPGLLYQALVYRGAPADYPLTFFRGQGIDLVTLFVPTQRYNLLAHILHIGPAAWEGWAFYGNGNNANYNFIGLLAPLWGFGALLIAAREKLPLRGVIVTVGIIWVAGFVLSLGPSLKIADTRPNSAIGPGLQTWDMPAEEATVSLPTQALFELPVIRTMRFTYRWQLVSRFALAAIVGISLPWLLTRKMLLSCILGLVVIAESLPTSVLLSYRNAATERRRWDQLLSQVVVPLRPHVENRRVLFLPASNDHLITLIAPFTNSYSYNDGFDKELNRIGPLQPARIITVERLYDQGALVPLDVCKLLKNNLADRVVFSYFSLNWSILNWPPKAGTINGFRRRAASLRLSEFPGLATWEEPLFLVVGPDPESGKCSPR